MRTVPLWKWLTVLFALLVSAYYLYPSFVWYQLDPGIRNSANPRTPEIERIDAKLKEIQSATGEAKSEAEIRRLESERQVETDKLHRLREGALPLGLDLAGGMHVVLEIEEATGSAKAADAAKLGPNAKSRDTLLDQALTVYRARIDKLGLTEPVVEKQPPRRILIQIPGVKNPEDVLKLLRATARLEFRLAAPPNLFAQAIDAVVRANPALRDRLPRSQSSELEVAARDIDSTSRAIKTAQLEVPPGHSFLWGPIEAKRETGDKVRKLFLIEDKPQMGGDNLTRAYVTYQTTVVTQPIVSIAFNREGTAQFARVTSENVGKNLAIVLDGVVYSAPVIKTAIRQGQAIIEGSFSTQEAQGLAVVLEAGALKTNVRIVENRTIGPSLGLDSIRQGVNASLWGLVATVAFMVLYYHVAGTYACIALVMNIIMLMAAMAMLHASITLPGIAGIILTMGMAVDANVLVYERIREEVAGRPGGSALAAIERGYSRAFSAIWDGNITTILTALVLMQYGTGPIKGFAITLTVGLIISMFTALFVTRIFQDWRAVGKKNEDLSLGRIRLFAGMKVDFMAISPYFVGVLVTFVVITVGYTMYHWSDIQGLELTGGTMVRLRYDQPMKDEDLRLQITKDLGIPDAQLQEVGAESKEFIIRLKKGTVIPKDQKVVEVIPGAGSGEERIGPGIIHTRPDEPEVDLGNFIVAGLSKLNPSNKVETTGLESFAASFGAELARTSVIIVCLSWIAILVYLAFRFQMVYAVGAVIALIHDTLLSFGMLGFSRLWGDQRELNLTVIAALLTVIGYSVNDTIVVFDRIRENRRGGKESLKDIINNSINQTLSRTIITAFTVFLVLVILYILGGPVLNDFSFVLLVGVAAGTYSSICIAGYLVYMWQGRKETLRAKS
jgi:SecD/SecF fusion protein